MLYAIYQFLTGRTDAAGALLGVCRIPVNFGVEIGHLWFVYMLLGLYLFAPVVSPWIETASRRAMEGYLALWAFTLCIPYVHLVFPELLGECFWNDTPMLYYFSGFLGYMVLAAYLRRYPETRLARLLQNRAAALALGLGLPLVNTAIRAMLETRGLTDGKAFQYVAYYRTALGALPNLLAALALFYLFKGLDLGCVRWVNALAGTTLGVYILHQVPAFRGLLWNGLLQAEAHHGSVGYTLLAILAVFLGCAAVDALRTALVMRPLENTRLFKALCEKGDALAAKITADD